MRGGRKGGIFILLFIGQKFIRRWHIIATLDALRGDGSSESVERLMLGELFGPGSFSGVASVQNFYTAIAVSLDAISWLLS